MTVGNFPGALTRAASLNIVMAENHRKLSQLVEKTKAEAAEMDRLMATRHAEQHEYWQSQTAQFQSEMAILTPLHWKEHMLGIKIMVWGRNSTFGHLDPPKWGAGVVGGSK